MCKRPPRPICSSARRNSGWKTIGSVTAAPKTSTCIIVAEQIQVQEVGKTPSRSREHEQAGDDLHRARAANQEQHIVDQDAGRDDVDHVGDADVAEDENSLMQDTVPFELLFEHALRVISGACRPLAAMRVHHASGSGVSSAFTRPPRKDAEFRRRRGLEQTRTGCDRDPLEDCGVLHGSHASTPPGRPGPPSASSSAARLLAR